MDSFIEECGGIVVQIVTQKVSRELGSISVAYLGALRIEVAGLSQSFTYRSLGGPSLAIPC
jgi:hypothetical protein